MECNFLQVLDQIGKDHAAVNKYHIAMTKDRMVIDKDQNVNKNPNPKPETLTLKTLNQNLNQMVMKP